MRHPTSVNVNIGCSWQRFTFVEGDGFEIIAAYADDEHAAFFVDPPYTAAARLLYSYWEVDHRRLFSLLDDVRGSVLLTYDNTIEVASWAREFGFETQAVAMKNTHHARMTELSLEKISLGFGALKLAPKPLLKLFKGHWRSASEPLHCALQCCELHALQRHAVGTADRSFIVHDKPRNVCAGKVIHEADLTERFPERPVHNNGCLLAPATESRDLRLELGHQSLVGGGSVIRTSDNKRKRQARAGPSAQERQIRLHFLPREVHGLHFQSTPSHLTQLPTYENVIDPPSLLPGFFNNPFPAKKWDLRYNGRHIAPEQRFPHPGKHGSRLQKAVGAQAYRCSHNRPAPILKPRQQDD